MSAVENNEAVDKSRKSGLELSIDFEFAESFGADYLPFFETATLAVQLASIV